MGYRVVKDFLGEVLVPKGKLWGAQTQRSLEKFKIGQEKMPLEIIRALVLIKKAAAEANAALDLLTEEIAVAIVQACQEVLAGHFADNFPLMVWQTGSGTQTNMNVNEVIAYRANQILGENLVDPHDHVNLGQSSNDVFPTAIHLAGVVAVEDRLIPVLEKLEKTLNQKSQAYNQVLKLGRTHLQDALPLTFGQEISAWMLIFSKHLKCLKENLNCLRELAIGGTAVGTGYGTHPEFAAKVVRLLQKATGKKLAVASNKFYALTSQSPLVIVHGILKALAADIMKMANDLSWLASGPRCGLGEIELPANEPGSSMMPGKINPTQCEAITMVACQVMGNDLSISLAASQGQLQLNTFMPVCAYNFLQSLDLLSSGLASFEQHCLRGLKPCVQQMQFYVDNSLMLATALSRHLGYEKTAVIVNKAIRENLTLKTAALEVLTEAKFKEYVQPEKMV
ncbi:MAG TPA: class II fumarate hydratase [Clostridia bacterium]|jgi:fumarate hydratase class II|nr:class II fumarate hydratase [Clostridia bacterium]